MCRKVGGVTTGSTGIRGRRIAEDGCGVGLVGGREGERAQAVQGHPGHEFALVQRRGDRQIGRGVVAGEGDDVIDAMVLAPSLGRPAP